MLKQQARLFYKLSILADAVVICSAFFAAYYVRFWWHKSLKPWDEYIWIVFLAVPVWCFVFHKYKLYKSIRRLNYFSIFARIMNSMVTASLFTASFIYFFDRYQYSRSLYILFVLFSTVFIFIEKLSLKLLLGFARSKGRNTRNLVIVGTFSKAAEFINLVEKHEDWGLKILGVVQVSDAELKSEFERYKVLGRIDDLVEICKVSPVDEVVFCLQKDQLVDIDEHFRKLEVLGVTLRVALDFFNVSSVKKELSFFHDSLPIITYYSKTFDEQQLFIKRVVDILGAIVGLSVFAVLFPFLAVAIKTESPGPIFFGQTRVRENGRLFKCWKLRSMYVDAESRKKDLMEQNEMKGAIFKIKDDPRITRVGKFIRRTSLDELPQFWNVLKGEMSLVGTRPPTEEEVQQYENWHHRRISIKPGITGLWQVNGRSSIDDFDEIVHLDLKYIDTWSIWLDFRLLLQTLVVVFLRRDSC